MNALQASAVQLTNEASALESIGRYREALEKLQGAAIVLDRLLATAMSSTTERAAVATYLHQLRRHMETVAVQAKVQPEYPQPTFTPSVVAQPKPAVQPQSKPSTTAGVPERSPAPVPPKPAPAPTPPPSNPRKDKPTEPARVPAAPKPQQTNLSSLGPMSALGGTFAPRTSDFVLKGIDVATQLVAQSRLKEAIDVVQHCYDLGKKEANNPSNFASIKETLDTLHRKYYAENKPRPLQDNPLTAEDVELLRKSGRTTSIFLPMWDDVDEGYGAENVFMPCKDGEWTDESAPGFCPDQLKRGVQWKSFLGLTPDLSTVSLVGNADPMNIKQTVVGDCSLVASLIVCSNFQQRFPKAKIIANAIYPQDSTGKPVVNHKGKYCVKLLINGATRLVTVDDRIPVERSTSTPLGTYSLDPSEQWVSLMEKAFLKVCGGTYDFPGSTSSSDLYKLSGWLPDSIGFEEKTFDPVFQFTRLSANHNKGAVLITANTPSNMDASVEQELGLVPGHAYAVLDFTTYNGERLVKVKNPWARVSWTGRYSIKDTVKCTDEFRKAVNYTDDHAAQGVFYVMWEDLIKYYRRLHISWNPYLLFTKDGGPSIPTRLACHGEFVYSAAKWMHPQFHINVEREDGSKPTRMHLVLSRHVLDLSEYASKNEQEDESVVPFLCVDVYDTTDIPPLVGTGRRVVHGMELPPDCALVEGAYRQVPAFTTSFTCPPGRRNLTVTISQLKGNPETRFPFSITLHTELSTNSVSFQPILIRTLPHASVVRGAWVKGVSCGGKSENQTYVFNPQYRLRLSEPTNVNIRLAAETKESVQLHVVLPKPTQDHADGTKAPVTPWAGRIANANSSYCNVALEFPAYIRGGAVVDSSLPKCFAFDKIGMFPQHAAQSKRKSEQVRNMVVSIAHQPDKSLLVSPVLPFHTVRTLLLRAAAEGCFASPYASKVVAQGKSLEPIDTAPIIQLTSAMVVLGTERVEPEEDEDGGDDDEGKAKGPKPAKYLPLTRPSKDFNPDEEAGITTFLDPEQWQHAEAHIFKNGRQTKVPEKPEPTGDEADEEKEKEADEQDEEEEPPAEEEEKELFLPIKKDTLFAVITLPKEPNPEDDGADDAGGDPPAEEEAAAEDEAAEAEAENKPLEDEDVPDDDPERKKITAWTIQAVNNLYKKHAVAVVRSLRWPGAYAYASRGGKEWACVYFGNGVKQTDYAFCPIPAPPILGECADIVEAKDPTAAAEKLVLRGEEPKEQDSEDEQPDEEGEGDG